MHDNLEKPNIDLDVATDLVTLATAVKYLLAVQSKHLESTASLAEVTNLVFEAQGKLNDSQDKFNQENIKVLKLLAFLVGEFAIMTIGYIYRTEIKSVLTWITVEISEYWVTFTGLPRAEKLTNVFIPALYMILGAVLWPNIQKAWKKLSKKN